MIINIDNYELYVIDYLEDNLNKIKKQEMTDFLGLQPHISEEIKSLNEFKFTEKDADSLDADFMMSLKKNEIIKTKTISEDTYETVFIAQIEGDLNTEESGNLNSFLKENPSLKAEFKLQESLRFQADEEIIFENKAILKKKSRLVVLWPSVAAIAALMILSFWVFKPQEISRTPLLLSKIESKPASKIITKKQPIKLESREKTIRIANSTFEEETLSRPIFDLEKLATISASQIALENTNWQNEMLLRQSFAYTRNELSIDIDYSDLKDDKRSVMKMISSLLWETTKGQIKNMKKTLVDDNLNQLQAQNIEELTNGFIAVKAPKKREIKNTN